MITVKDILSEGITPSENLIKLVPKDDILFFDIETTGLSKKTNHIYLIGCGRYDNNNLEIIQWFAENESDETNVLKAFLDYSASFESLVNYNGKSFDIPFITERLSKHGLSMPEFNSIDLYTYVKPFKRVLSLCDLTQKTIESFLGIKREDKYNGGELIPVYKNYVKSGEGLELLLLHNKEDVINMHHVVGILDYTNVFNAEIKYESHVIKEFRDFNGDIKKELVIYGLHNALSLPKSFNTYKNDGNGSYIMNVLIDGTLKIRVPLFYETMSYYFENYKDYYYIPSEDICILKSMAGGISKDNRINATKENCRIKVTDIFIYSPIKLPRMFQREAGSKEKFIRLCDFEALSEEDKSSVLNAIYKYFL